MPVGPALGAGTRLAVETRGNENLRAPGNALKPQNPRNFYSFLAKNPRDCVTFWGFWGKNLGAFLGFFKIPKTSDQNFHVPTVHSFLPFFGKKLQGSALVFGFLGYPRVGVHFLGLFVQVPILGPKPHPKNGVWGN